MRRWIPTLGIVALAAAGCDEGTTLPPEDETPTSVTAPSFQYLIDPALLPARTAVPVQALAAVTAEEESGDPGASACTTVDFEGLADLAAVGTPPGAPDVAFGTSWLALIDLDDGGSGPIANEPSASTVAVQMDGVDTDIVLGTPAAVVSVFYSAASLALPLILEGLDGEGGVVASATGTTVGMDLDGAACTGDPNGNFCLWDLLEIDADEATIETIRIQGMPNAFAIDDLSVCGAEQEEEGPEDGDLSIDIKPGNDLNPINPRSEGKVPVAVLGSEDLDVTTLDPASITLGDGEDAETPVALMGGDRPMAQVVDVNHDGYPDLRVHFDVGQLVENGDLHEATEWLVLSASAFAEEAGEADEASASEEGAGEGDETEAAASSMTGSDFVRIVSDDGEAGSGEETDDVGAQDEGAPRDSGNGKKNGHEKN